MRMTPESKQRAYSIYRHLVPWPLYRLRDTEILSQPLDYSSAPLIAERFNVLLSRPEPVYFARIGGCEYEAAAAYFRDRSEFARPSSYMPHLERVQELAGYFDFDHDYANFERFLVGQIRSYRDADVVQYGGVRLITMFRHNVFLPKEMKLLGHVCRGKTCVDYTFVELAIPFLESFKLWAEGKRILVISPLSRSLQHQYQRRDDLIAGYRFPDFELSTYSSPVTWSTMDDTRESTGFMSNNWHEELARMCAEVALLDFDVALLSCGSYASQLGDFIRHQMGRKAVYLGGVLNVLFNIYGPRYEAVFGSGLTNPETLIDALEYEDIAELRGGRKYENEAMRAYFGKRGA